MIPPIVRFLFVKRVAALLPVNPNCVPITKKISVADLKLLDCTNVKYALKVSVKKLINSGFFIRNTCRIFHYKTT